MLIASTQIPATLLFGMNRFYHYARANGGGGCVRQMYRNMLQLLLLLTPLTQSPAIAELSQSCAALSLV